jgi:serine/threonine protein kinase
MVADASGSRSSASTTDKIGDYEIVRLIGEGGMGVVYEGI